MGKEPDEPWVRALAEERAFICGGRRVLFTPYVSLAKGGRLLEVIPEGIRPAL